MAARSARAGDSFSRLLLISANICVPDRSLTCLCNLKQFSHHSSPVALSQARKVIRENVIEGNGISDVDGNGYIMAI